MGLVLTSPRPSGPHPLVSLVTSAIRRLRRSGTAVLSSRPESSRGVVRRAPTSRVLDTGPDGYLLQAASGPVPSHPYLAALRRVNQRRVASLHAANRGAPAATSLRHRGGHRDRRRGRPLWRD